MKTFTFALIAASAMASNNFYLNLEFDDIDEDGYTL